MTTKPETPAEQALRWLRSWQAWYEGLGVDMPGDALLSAAKFRLAADELELALHENAELRAAVTSAHERADQWIDEAAKLAEGLDRAQARIAELEAHACDQGVEIERLEAQHSQGLREAEKRLAELERVTKERDKYHAQAVALFWNGNADGVTASKVREAAAQIEEALK